MRLTAPIVKRPGQAFGFIFDKDPSNLWDIIVVGKSIGTVGYFSEINIGDVILTVNGKKVGGMSIPNLTSFVESCNMLDVTYTRNAQLVNAHTSHVAMPTYQANNYCNGLTNNRTASHNVVIDLVDEDDEPDYVEEVIPSPIMRTPIKKRKREDDAEDITVGAASDGCANTSEPLSHVEKLKIKQEKFGVAFGEADIMGELEEVHPSKSEGTACNTPKFQSSIDENSDPKYDKPETAGSDNVAPARNERAFSLDDIEFVGGNAVGLSDMPHLRESCCIYKFVPRSMDNLLHCNNCYCYICDKSVSLCGSWPSHCHASHKDSFWKRERAEVAKEMREINSFLNTPYVTDILRSEAEKMEFGQHYSKSCMEALTKDYVFSLAEKKQKVLYDLNRLDGFIRELIDNSLTKIYTTSIREDTEHDSNFVTNNSISINSKIHEMSSKCMPSEQYICETKGYVKYVLGSCKKEVSFAVILLTIAISILLIDIPEYVEHMEDTISLVLMHPECNAKWTEIILKHWVSWMKRSHSSQVPMNSGCIWKSLLGEECLKWLDMNTTAYGITNIEYKPGYGCGPVFGRNIGIDNIANAGVNAANYAVVSDTFSWMFQWIYRANPIDWGSYKVPTLKIREALKMMKTLVKFNYCDIIIENNGVLLSKCRVLHTVIEELFLRKCDEVDYSISYYLHIYMCTPKIAGLNMTRLMSISELILDFYENMDSAHSGGECMEKDDKKIGTVVRDSYVDASVFDELSYIAIAMHYDPGVYAEIYPGAQSLSSVPFNNESLDLGHRTGTHESRARLIYPVIFTLRLVLSLESNTRCTDVFLKIWKVIVASICCYKTNFFTKSLDVNSNMRLSIPQLLEQFEDKHTLPMETYCMEFAELPMADCSEFCYCTILALPYIKARLTNKEFNSYDNEIECVLTGANPEVDHILSKNECFGRYIEDEIINSRYGMLVLLYGSAVAFWNNGQSPTENCLKYLLSLYFESEGKHSIPEYMCRFINCYYNKTSYDYAIDAEVVGLDDGITHSSAIKYKSDGRPVFEEIVYPTPECHDQVSLGLASYSKIYHRIAAIGECVVDDHGDGMYLDHYIRSYRVHIEKRPDIENHVSYGLISLHTHTALHLLWRLLSTDCPYDESDRVDMRILCIKNLYHKLKQCVKNCFVNLRDSYYDQMPHGSNVTWSEYDVCRAIASPLAVLLLYGAVVNKLDEMDFDFFGNMLMLEEGICSGNVVSSSGKDVCFLSRRGEKHENACRFWIPKVELIWEKIRVQWVNSTPREIQHDVVWSMLIHGKAWCNLSELNDVEKMCVVESFFSFQGSYGLMATVGNTSLYKDILSIIEWYTNSEEYMHVGIAESMWQFNWNCFNSISILIEYAPELLFEILYKNPISTVLQYAFDYRNKVHTSYMKKDEFIEANTKRESQSLNDAISMVLSRDYYELIDNVEPLSLYCQMDAMHSSSLVSSDTQFLNAFEKAEVGLLLSCLNTFVDLFRKYLQLEQMEEEGWTALMSMLINIILLECSHGTVIKGNDQSKPWVLKRSKCDSENSEHFDDIVVELNENSDGVVDHVIEQAFDSCEELLWHALWPSDMNPYVCILVLKCMCVVLKTLYAFDCMSKKADHIKSIAHILPYIAQVLSIIQGNPDASLINVMQECVVDINRLKCRLSTQEILSDQNWLQQCVWIECNWMNGLNHTDNAAQSSYDPTTSIDTNFNTCHTGDIKITAGNLVCKYHLDRTEKLLHSCNEILDQHANSASYWDIAHYIDSVYKRIFDSIGVAVSNIPACSLQRESISVLFFLRNCARICKSCSVLSIVRVVLENLTEDLSLFACDIPLIGCTTSNTDANSTQSAHKRDIAEIDKQEHLLNKLIITLMHCSEIFSPLFTDCLRVALALLMFAPQSTLLACAYKQVSKERSLSGTSMNFLKKALYGPVNTGGSNCLFERLCLSARQHVTVTPIELFLTGPTSKSVPIYSDWISTVKLLNMFKGLDLVMLLEHLIPNDMQTRSDWTFSDVAMESMNLWRQQALYPYVVFKRTNPVEAISILLQNNKIENLFELLNKECDICPKFILIAIQAFCMIRNEELVNCLGTYKEGGKCVFAGDPNFLWVCLNDETHGLYMMSCWLISKGNNSSGCTLEFQKEMDTFASLMYSLCENVSTGTMLKSYVLALVYMRNNMDERVINCMDVFEASIGKGKEVFQFITKHIVNLPIAPSSALVVCKTMIQLQFSNKSSLPHKDEALAAYIMNVAYNALTSACVISEPIYMKPSKEACGQVPLEYIACDTLYINGVTSSLNLTTCYCVHNIITNGVLDSCFVNNDLSSAANIERYVKKLNRVGKDVREIISLIFDSGLDIISAAGGIAEMRDGASNDTVTLSALDVHVSVLAMDFIKRIAKWFMATMVKTFQMSCVSSFGGHWIEPAANTVMDCIRKLLLEAPCRMEIDVSRRLLTTCCSGWIMCLTSMLFDPTVNTMPSVVVPTPTSLPSRISPTRSISRFYHMYSLCPVSLTEIPDAQMCVEVGKLINDFSSVSFEDIMNGNQTVFFKILPAADAALAVTAAWNNGHFNEWKSVIYIQFMVALKKNNSSALPILCIVFHLYAIYIKPMREILYGQATHIPLIIPDSFDIEKSQAVEQFLYDLLDICCQFAPVVLSKLLFNNYTTTTSCVKLEMDKLDPKAIDMPYLLQTHKINGIIDATPYTNEYFGNISDIQGSCLTVEVLSHFHSLLLCLFPRKLAPVVNSPNCGNVLLSIWLEALRIICNYKRANCKTTTIGLHSSLTLTELLYSYYTHILDASAQFVKTDTYPKRAQAQYRLDLVCYLRCIKSLFTRNCIVAADFKAMWINFHSDVHRLLKEKPAVAKATMDALL